MKAFRPYTVLILIPAMLFSITFERQYGGNKYDKGYCVEQTSDSGYIITGYTWSYGAGFADIYLIRTDKYGDTLWTKTFGGEGSDYGYGVEETHDHGFIVCGVFDHPATYECIYLINLDSLGNIRWENLYSSSKRLSPKSVHQTADGCFAVCGTKGYASDADVYLMKVNSNGIKLWERTYTGPSGDCGKDFLPTKDAGFILLALTTTFQGDYDIWIIKTDSAGNVLWAKIYGWERDEHPHSIRTTPDGGYICTGGTWSFGSVQKTFVIKTDSTGDSLWTKIYEGVARAIRPTLDGGYILIGNKPSGINSKIFLLKLDSQGNEIWCRMYPEGLRDASGECGHQTKDKGYIITGSTRYDVYLIKTDSLGNVAVIKEFPSHQPPVRFTAFPNPFQDGVIIKFSPPLPRGAKIRIYDPSGRLILSFRLSTKQSEIKLGQQLKNGIYFLYVNDSKIFKLVKNGK